MHISWSEGTAELIQKLSLFQTLGDILLGHVADVLADEGFDFELEAVLEHQVDLFLPGFFLFEPGVALDLVGPLDVLLVELDLYAVWQVAGFVISAPQADVAG